MFEKLAAQLTTAIYFMGQDRDERGQTTAEYVGILAFVAVLAVAFITFKQDIADTAKGIVTTALGKISDAIG